MFTPFEIKETVDMFMREHLDIRAITLGISLLDCCTGSGDSTRARIYEKITRVAHDLVKTGNEIENEFGIPIINKRISVTPIAMVAESSGDRNYTPYAEVLDKAGKEVGIDFIGGFSALVHKGFTSGDRILISSIPEALSVTDRVCASVNVGTTKSGINMDAVREMGTVIKDAAERTKDRDGLACAKLVVFCNAPEDNPFMAGAFHGVGEPESAVNVGVSGPGVIKSGLERFRGASLDVVADEIKKMAFKITRMGHLVAEEASRRLGVPFGIIDLSLAPTPAVG
ncbi:MAG TPA: DUF711 family protein, partial [Spirochaetia bacterium]|nr:DUF711 family protein [Spirochaetia bacterium]